MQRGDKFMVGSRAFRVGEEVENTGTGAYHKGTKAIVVGMSKALNYMDGLHVRLVYPDGREFDTHVSHIVVNRPLLPEPDFGLVELQKAEKLIQEIEDGKLEIGDTVELYNGAEGLHFAEPNDKSLPWRNWEDKIKTGETGVIVSSNGSGLYTLKVDGGYGSASDHYLRTPSDVLPKPEFGLEELEQAQQLIEEINCGK